VVNILAELRRWPLEQACSLLPSDDGNAVLGEIAGLRSKIVPPFGPFGTAREYYTAIVRAHLSLIKEGKLFPEFAVEAHLIYSVLINNIDRLLEEERDGETESFYLTHIDAKGDNLLLDEQGFVTEIIY
jgi:hypothetical protein